MTPPLPLAGRAGRAWRTVATAASFLLFGIATLLASCVLLLLVRPLPIGERARQRWTLGAIRALSVGFVRWIRLVGLMGYRITGEPIALPSSANSRPDGRAVVPGPLITCNHPSLIDALFVIAVTPALCCIVKRALFDNPFTGPLVRMAGYLPNDSETLVGDAAAVLARGRALLVFPEGTRNRDDTSLRFLRGAAHIAIESGAPVQPVTIDFSPRSLQKGDPWHRIPPRASTIIVTIHAPLDPVARAQLPPVLPVTLAARRLNDRLRAFYAERVAGFQAPTRPHAPTAARPSPAVATFDPRRGPA